MTGARRHGFGIVGAGVIASTHAAALAAVTGARLVAVTDFDSERAGRLAAAYGATAEVDLDTLLGRGDIDVVSVCVPSGLHAAVGERAAAAGKHLVVEKPIEVTLAAADRLIGAARAAGVAMTVISQHRFDPGVTELRRLLDDGTLGRLVLGEASTKWYRSQGYYDSAAWRGTPALDGGSLMNQGIHYVDLLRWSMGPVTEVTAMCTTQIHEVEVEDVALAMLRFSCGAVGTIVSSTAVYPGFAQRLQITGTEGTVVVENGQIAFRALRAEESAAGNPATGKPAAGERAAGMPATGEPAAGEPVAGEPVAGMPAAGMPVAGMPATGKAAAGKAATANPAALDVAGHAAQIADLLDAIDDGRPPAVTGEDGRHALEIVCAVYESARRGRAVTLPAAPDATAGPAGSAAPARSAGPAAPAGTARRDRDAGRAR